MVYNDNSHLELQTRVRFFGGVNGLKIVECDQIPQGKRIKIGDVIIVGTKPIMERIVKYA